VPSALGNAEDYRFGRPLLMLISGGARAASDETSTLQTAEILEW
jgi:hypothetical protein